MACMYVYGMLEIRTSASRVRWTLLLIRAVICYLPARQANNAYVAQAVNETWIFSHFSCFCLLFFILVMMFLYFLFIFVFIWLVCQLCSAFHCQVKMSAQKSWGSCYFKLVSANLTCLCMFRSMLVYIFICVLAYL